jgi:exodeoxyribonuclease VII small subunit
MSEIKDSFEGALEQLQSMVKRLESGELSLDQALKSFEDGVKLTRQCQQLLGAAEQKIDILMSSGDGKTTLEPFQPARSPQNG